VLDNLTDTIISTNDQNEKIRDHVIGSSTDYDAHLGMTDWLKSFMIPALFESSKHRIEHPHANTSWKRFTFGGHFREYIPFRVQVVAAFVFFVLCIQITITGLLSKSIYDTLSKEMTSTENKELALSTISSTSSQQCELLSQFDSSAVATSICTNLKSGPADLNCTSIGSHLNSTPPAVFITQCENGNATDLWLFSWPMLDPESYNVFATLCVPDETALRIKLNELEGVCDRLDLISIFPSSSDWEDARGPLSVGLYVALSLSLSFSQFQTHTHTRTQVCLKLLFNLLYRLVSFQLSCGCVTKCSSLARRKNRNGISIS